MTGLEIRISPEKGRCVHAKRNFRSGEIIEECHVIVIAATNAMLREMGLYDYAFQWSDKRKVAIATGYGSLYNHSYRPNAEYFASRGWKKLVFRAIKLINTGDEITVNYNCTPSSNDPLWFGIA
jgi:uncharacterized protein